MQRVTLALTVRVDPADAAIAAAIGSPGGVLSGATVVARRSGAADSLVGQSDASGVVQFSNVLAGTYTVSAVRLLSAAERAQLASDDADVTAFGGGGQVSAQASGGGTPTVAVNVTTVAGRRGSLVVSELYAHAVPIPGAETYVTADYVELYNNADTTIYLDGKIIGRGISWFRDYVGSPRTCADMEQWRTDPAGLWTAYFYKFPGTGTTYPLAPGQAAVVATDAIDHRQYLASLPNLSMAQFEFIGPSDVDNPSVPNMVNIGLREWSANVIGHGLTWNGIGIILYVADSLDPATLVHDNLPVVNPDHVRIPAAKVLDVFTSIMTPALEATLTPPCQELVNAAFDRGYAELLDDDPTRSIRRHPLFETALGRWMLQRTVTSSRDFGVNSPSPRTVP